jgi:maltose alpha-D-glucosyltransferase/alpha-amylase
VLQNYVPNEGDGWSYTLDVLRAYIERALTEEQHVRDVVVPQKSPLEMVDDEIPPFARDHIEHYLVSAWRLGMRTAELHLALSAPGQDASFVPEPFSGMYQRSLYQTMRSQVGRVFQGLHKSLKSLPEDAQDDARRVLASEELIFRSFSGILRQKITAMRTRVHGDYHLGQVLYTGDDFVLLDFEGEPARPLHERRRKRSPLTDVAGMLRSFHYAAYTALFSEVQNGIIRSDNLAEMERWVRSWYLWVSAAFLKSYLDTGAQAVFLPGTRAEINTLLHAYQLDKAVYELGYELNNRPGWVHVPLWGILQLLEHEGG